MWYSPGECTLYWLSSHSLLPPLFCFSLGSSDKIWCAPTGNKSSFFTIGNKKRDIQNLSSNKPTDLTVRPTWCLGNTPESNAGNHSSFSEELILSSQREMKRWRGEDEWMDKMDAGMKHNWGVLCKERQNQVSTSFPRIASTKVSAESCSPVTSPKLSKCPSEKDSTKSLFTLLLTRERPCQNISPFKGCTRSRIN